MVVSGRPRSVDAHDGFATRGAGPSLSRAGGGRPFSPTLGRGGQPPGRRSEDKSPMADYDRVGVSMSRQRSALGKTVSEKARGNKAHKIFRLLDTNNSNTISKLEFLAGMQQEPDVAEFILPGVSCDGLMRDARVFDSVCEIFAAVGNGHQRISQSDFLQYFVKKQLGKPQSDDESVFDELDLKRTGLVSKLTFIKSLQSRPSVGALLRPGFDFSNLLEDETAFDTADSLFTEIAVGRRSIDAADFVKYCDEKRRTSRAYKQDRVRQVFNLIDSEGTGKVSKLAFIAAMQQNYEIDEFILPGADSSQVMHDEWKFDAIDAVFGAITQGKKWMDYLDFESYFRKVRASSPKDFPAVDRPSKRVLIIGPGFGQVMNPGQYRTIENAGFKVGWCSNIPNPEQRRFNPAPYLGELLESVQKFRPDVVLCASKGGVYIVGMWQLGYWRGPTVMINAHPSCSRLPPDIPVVVCHGSNDEVYPTPRSELEDLLATASDNHGFLYYTANSGQVAPGTFTRQGDYHNMESLQSRDCLPRLIDAVLCPDGPEIHMTRTWVEQLGSTRRAAERWLGYDPGLLTRFWTSKGRSGLDAEKLFSVHPSTEEFRSVAAIFKGAPREVPAYSIVPQARWEMVRVTKIERVENGEQAESSTNPYYAALRRTIEHQGLTFEPGVHTRWGFHAADSKAIHSIITDPLGGFQPLASGSRNASVWGVGTYFSRDAQYLAGNHFCGQPAADGSRQMLLCLLMTGMVCLGDPNHRGVLPFRQKPHRYNSAVDSLSSPEVHIMHYTGAMLPCYLISFA